MRTMYLRRIINSYRHCYAYYYQINIQPVEYALFSLTRLRVSERERENAREKSERERENVRERTRKKSEREVREK